MSDIVLLDSRVMSFGGEPKRIVGACHLKTGVIQIMKELPFTEKAKKTSQSYHTVVVTDSMALVQDWGIAFYPKEHFQEVISVYQLRERAKLVHLDDSLQRYNPNGVLQVRKLDVNGLEQEFDSSSVDNGHIAVLLLVWAGFKAKNNQDCMMPVQDDDFDPTLVPFTVM